MPALVGTVEIYAGDSFDWPTYTFKDGTDVARDLEAEGWTNWAAQWRATEDDTQAIDLIVDDAQANEGTIRISASAEQTRDMEGPGVWDLQATRGSEVKTWVRGKTKYRKDVTRV